MVAVELGRVRVGGAQQERASPSGKSVAVGMLGVQVLEPVRGQLVAELRVRRAADPERMPRAEHVVAEARARVISAVRIAPPSQSFRSSTQTLQPASRQQRARRRAR